MTQVLDLIRQWGPYLALPIIVAFITQGLKNRIPFFGTVKGVRIVHFIPLVLGIIGGFLLPEETWQNKILIGGGLGSLSILLYKVVTVSLAKSVDLENRILLKKLDLSEVEADKFVIKKVSKG